jgi:hypothetical protein
MSIKDYLWLYQNSFSMKKIQKLSILLVCTLAIISCKKDKANPSNQDLVIGKWRVSAQVTILGGITSDDYSSIPDCEKNDFIEFKSNGEFIEDEGSTKCDNTKPQTSSGTWSMNANGTAITITRALFNNQPVTFEVQEISDTRLKIRANNLQGSGFDRVYTYTKIP